MVYDRETNGNLCEWIARVWQFQPVFWGDKLKNKGVSALCFFVKILENEYMKKKSFKRCNVENDTASFCYWTFFSWFYFVFKFEKENNLEWIGVGTENNLDFWNNLQIYWPMLL